MHLAFSNLEFSAFSMLCSSFRSSIAAISIYFMILFNLFCTFEWSSQILTAMAFKLFAQENVDVAVIEVNQFSLNFF